MISAIVLWGLTGFLVVASLLPLSKIPFGTIRGLAFPREQFFGLAMVLLPLMIFGPPVPWASVGVALLLGVAVIQLIYIAKFTPVWKKQSIDASPAELANKGGQISLLAANVKQSNRAYDRLIALVQQKTPDILMAIEVDEEWIAALRGALGGMFPHWVEVPLGNSYGLCLMSRLPLAETEVRELVTEGVPSIRTKVTLPDGQQTRLYVVHPEPPIISHDTKGRDSEIALIGLEAAEDLLPAIVTGDLNDVAWSTTTRRFQRLSGLLDPRVGRGFYNTFSATMPWMRWPLDHLFHDARFRLIEMARLDKIGSDHFPMWFVLALTGDALPDTLPEQADAQEERDVKDMIAEEKKRDREAIGSDWEDG
ncbi:endonuclease/exonuclease/phosphatase family protein [Sulfitobacter mediterraneus]|uniref:endonuclease/exonuclease/phosphatase family protein n=1 Tax=Sulfitobacter mediterraneus TaxID=83219 RepID=UPI0019327DC4|nr:endonuclease/exonuclease/phosphatase family protein [Sulfitobacter mediterraneus]MBM1310098.1 endonuclease/exonuclease/phosphatase family protein [Sulfitobacter mediterraneus]MBM1313982.1 endonuclease/exonuclease/phosphatase family protein [Sulfitobacter mediterraneus]MBM1322342.1 endonuclease/exonuclease/phosphatase family protein [Sulfitobacter mediterraneus]MBM1326254.1 endonuclease/exonuclease/phosphatase family protein [Sulfitobacter mediterraneus]MBM1397600.1 endonuclease/exonuclease/